jgi:glycine cleavage system aminomethyltransferase T
MYDMTPLSRYEVSGPGSAEFLQRATTNNVDKSVGSVTYALMLDESGGILSDVTVTRLAADRFMVGGNGHLDLVHLKGLLPADGSVAIRDITAGTCCIGLWGPEARNVLGKLTDADISHEGFKYFRAKQFHVAGVSVTALRVSYVGELGWELYTTADQGLRLWDSIAEAGREFGIVPAGRLAFNSLRMEKGYRSWGTDMSREHTPDEAGLGFAVSLKKEDFIGRAALASRDSGRRLVTVVLDERDGMAAGEPVLVPGAGSPAGYVTSADYGYSIDAFMAYAWVPQELAAPGTRLEISYFGRRQAGTVRPDALFDPDMTLLRR